MARTTAVKKQQADITKIRKTMKEFQEGKLKTSDGRPVTRRDQAIAISVSEKHDRKRN